MFYRHAQLVTTESGIPHEVDHIIPLQGKRVSGLHVETNLRVIPQAVNRAKNNRYDEELVGRSGIEPLTSTV